VIEIAGEQRMIALEDLSNQKKIFFVTADQQHMQERGCELGKG